MSRTLSAELTTHLATRAHKRARLLRLDLVDGSVIAVSDHDAVLSVDLGDGAADYVPETGIVPSDLLLTTGFESDEIEVAGPLVETATEAWHVTKAAILGGRFDDAVARFFQVRWSQLSDGPVRLLKGKVERATIMGGSFKLTIRSEISRFQQEVGRTITGYCDADFGDSRCGYSPATLAATVASVTDERQFAVSFTGTYADDYFNKGTVRFTSGALNGTRKVEVSDFTGGTGSGSVVLWTNLAEAPQVGDTLTFTQGCGKTRADCLAYDNVVNFRGFPDVPGADQVLRYPNPGG